MTWKPRQCITIIIPHFPVRLHGGLFIVMLFRNIVNPVWVKMESDKTIALKIYFPELKGLFISDLI